MKDRAKMIIEEVCPHVFTSFVAQSRDESVNNADDQYSMIVKNVEDLEEPVFDFTSHCQTPTHEDCVDYAGEEDMMTVIEND